MLYPLTFVYDSVTEFCKLYGDRKSDIRIDLQQTENIEKRFKGVISYVKNDKEVEKYATFVTSTFKMVNADGTHENLNVEMGDFTTFPLDYIQGRAPK